MLNRIILAALLLPGVAWGQLSGPSVPVLISHPFSIYANPTVPVCAAANCPSSGTFASSVIKGITVKDYTLGEFLGADSLYVNTGQPNGQKVGRYIGVVQGPLGGTSWALNTDIVRNGLPNGMDGTVGSSSPGVDGAIPAANGTIGAELDYTNWDQDSSPGTGPFTVNLYLHNQSTNTSLAAIYLDNNPQTKVTLNSGPPDSFQRAAWSAGILFNGSMLIRDNAIFDGSSGTYSYQVGGTHTTSFYDNSTSQVGLGINGTHSIADISLTDTTPVGVAFNGTYSNAAISTAGGSTANALTTAAGQRICLDITDVCLLYNSGASALQIFSGGTTRFSVGTSTGAMQAGFANTSTGNGSVVLGALSISTGIGGFVVGTNSNDRGRYNSEAFSAGQFSGAGDAQAGTFVLRATTSSTTAVTLTADAAAPGAANCVDIPNNAAYALVVTLLAFDHTAPSKSYSASWGGGSAAPHIMSRGANAASTLVNGATSTVSPDASRSNGTLTGIASGIAADTTNGCLKVTFTAPTSNTDTWNVVAKVETVEVQ